VSVWPRPHPDPLSRRALRRALVGLAVAAVGLAVLTVILVDLRDTLSLASIVLLYLVVVVATAVVGGLTPSLIAALASDLVVNFYFVPPFHTLTVEHRDQVISLVVYVAVAITVSLAMDLAARQRAAAARTGVEAELLARISAEPVREGSTSALLDHVREVLHMDTAALVDADGQVVARAGRDPTGATVLSVPGGQGLTLVVEGPPLFAPDPRFVAQLAAAAARSLQAERLAAQAAHARELAEVDRLRAALLAAVGHDLRTPLAGIKAGASSLRDPDLELSPAEQDELLATIDESADRMVDLVENLLAMSRLQAGALSVHARPVALDEVVAAALLHQPEGFMPDVDVPDDLPLTTADPGLLERVVANLLTNAHHASPAPGTVHIVARARADRLELRVIDHGDGIPAADRDRVFAPFQRLDDRTTTGGLGLGLAIARGFTEAMDGTLTAGDTPGGGLTMTIDLPAV
jgi:two-component system, OmpR family, sensor histidine kinase KdpD